MITRRWFALAGILIAVFALSSATAQAGPSHTNFHVVHRAEHADYTSVSCIRVGLCLAVGYPGTAVLANGHWSSVSGKVPENTVEQSVSCVPSGQCVATGADHSVLYWVSRTGVTWRKVDIPAPRPHVSGYPSESVDCVRADWCIAVGSARARGQQESIEVSIWNGSAWQSRLLTSGYPRGLEAQHVSCWAARECRITAFRSVSGAAVVNAYVLNWSHGRAAVSMPFGDRGKYTDFPYISCISHVWCMALGGVSAHGIEHQHEATAIWNGTTWRVRASNVPSPPGKPYEPTSLFCLTRSVCVTSGILFTKHQGTGVAVWFHGTWTRRAIASAQVSLNGIACSSTAHCVAVGSHENTHTFTTQGYIEAGHL